MNQIINYIVRNYQDIKYSLLYAQTFDEKNFGFSGLYYKMLESDRTRINSFRNAFSYYNNFKNSVICEIGFGTLCLSEIYLPFVKKAYLIESNPELFDLIEQKISDNAWDTKAELKTVKGALPFIQTALSKGITI